MQPGSDLDAGPRVGADAVVLRYPDPDGRFAGVRLWQEVGVPGDRLDLARVPGGWELRLERPAVDRMEYLFELRGTDGSRTTVLDPGNPLRCSGAFGDHSVLELPGYAPPAWLTAAAPAGSLVEHTTRSANLSGDLRWRLWSPAGLGPDEPAPLVVVHDGPEYDALARVTRYLAALAAGGRRPAARAVLVEPGPRDERYSANAAYSRAVAQALLPAVRRAAPATAVVGIGASLGALALLHLHRHHPDTLDGLLLQSGSFFHRRLDAHERRFPRFDRIQRFVDGVLRSTTAPRPVPVVLTCGTVEENLGNNRMLARALAAQGYDVTLAEVRDAHNYTAWRDALHPHLADLLTRAAA